MALSVEDHPSEAQALEILRQVAARGVSFIDTADTYGRAPSDLHHNERLLATFLAGKKGGARIFVATKGGTIRKSPGWEIDGSPDRLYRVICESFEALGGEQAIFLWQHHWPDPRYSIKVMMEPVRRAVEEKLIQFVGVGNYSIQQIKEARDLVDVVSVQSQYNFWRREAERNGLLEYCETENLVFLPWRPLGGLGLAQRLGEIKPLADLASARGISPYQVNVAWHLAKAKCILPIPGSSRLENILDCLEAENVHLTRSEMSQLDAIAEADLPKRSRPPAWERMPPLSNSTA
jgi:aryl-alcohol dehydrogenase-like predicted oxidoreductase